MIWTWLYIAWEFQSISNPTTRGTAQNSNQPTRATIRCFFFFLSSDEVLARSLLFCRLVLFAVAAAWDVFRLETWIFPVSVCVYAAAADGSCFFLSFLLLMLFVCCWHHHFHRLLKQIFAKIPFLFFLSLRPASQCEKLYQLTCWWLCCCGHWIFNNSFLNLLFNFVLFTSIYFIYFFQPKKNTLKFRGFSSQRVCVNATSVYRNIDFDIIR